MKAVWAGSFNPFTIGHKYILDKAIEMFGKDNVTVLLAQNPNKSDVSSYLERHIKTFHLNVHTYNGLLVDFCKTSNINVIIKGLRSVTDFESELDQAHWNDKLSNGEVTTIFIPSPPELQKISSSAVRTIDKYNRSSEYFVNEYSEYRWRNRHPKYFIYFGKMSVGKSTILKNMRKVVDFDKFIWTWFTDEDIIKHKQGFYNTIMSGNVEAYDNKMCELSCKIDWDNLFKMALEISPYFEMSALGAWFKYIPVHLIADAELYNVTCNEFFRNSRALNRGLTEHDLKKFDKFYKLPPFWDKELDIS
jgi:pantetheine-phosphate adenylyltransferase